MQGVCERVGPRSDVPGTESPATCTCTLSRITLQGNMWVGWPKAALGRTGGPGVAPVW